MQKLFISYRSSDAPKVDKIARDLGLLRFDDATPRYTTWQDKHNLPPASPNWWDAIVDAIIDCDVFVFNLSRASLQSEVCRAELDYAHQRNRPIIPVVLDGEFFLNPQSGKYDLPKETWTLVPDWLGEAQFLFYSGAEFYSKFQIAIEPFERNPPRDIPAPRPLHPDNKGVHRNNHALYDDACNYAEKLAFTDAEKHFSTLVRRNDSDYADAAAQWLELIRLYAELIEITERRSAAFIFKKKWSNYTALFPKEFLEGIFDPKGFATQTEASVAIPPQPPQISKLEAAVTKARDFKGTKNRDWQPIIMKLGEIDPTTPMPDMEMCLVPVGKFMMGSNDRDNERPIHEQTIQQPYWIARYPVTNEQWQKAVRARIIDEPQDADSLEWYQYRTMAQCPVVGIDWIASLKFAQWIKCNLPTEPLWEYAARGVENWVYPWGNDWQDGKRVIWDNNGKKPNPVSSKPEGVSWVGAMHLSGNVWEWQLSAYRGYPYVSSDGREAESSNSGITRGVRGGSWGVSDTKGFRAPYRSRGFSPTDRYDFVGFRVSIQISNDYIISLFG